MCTNGGSDATRWIAEADLPGLLDIAERALRRAGGLSVTAAVSDTALTQLVQRLEALSRACQGQKLALVAEITERQAHRGHAAATAEDLLARMLNLSRGEAKAQAELATGLVELPGTAQALRDGRIGVGQAAVTVKKAEEVRGRQDGGELVAKLDEVGATAGQRMDKQRLSRQLDEVVHREAADVLAEREQRAWRRRGVWFTERDGVPGLEARLAVEGFATVKAALEALGRPDGAEDPRTPAQRHADALVALAERYLDAGKLPQVATQRPHVLLLTTPDALHGRPGAAPSLLDGHGPISDELARQICCDAEVTTVLTSEDGDVLNIGREHRLPNKHQRKAVIARDKVCVGCGANVTRCQIHHIIWWSDDGPTDLDNLVLVCWNCHRHIHHHGWQVTRDATGRYRAGPPGALDPSAAARRHTA